MLTTLLSYQTFALEMKIKSVRNPLPPRKIKLITKGFKTENGGFRAENFRPPSPINTNVRILEITTQN